MNTDIQNQLIFINELTEDLKSSKLHLEDLRSICVHKWSNARMVTSYIQMPKIDYHRDQWAELIERTTMENNIKTEWFRECLSCGLEQKTEKSVERMVVEPFFE